VNYGDEFRQKYVDDFHGILAATRATLGRTTASESVYRAARNLRGIGSLTESIMEEGVPRVRFDRRELYLERDQKGRGLLDILEPVSKSVDTLNRFKRYLVARRAAHLSAQNRENLLSPHEIQEGMRFHSATFDRVFNDLIDFRKKAADFGEATGLFSAEQRATWDTAQNAVSFFRQFGDQRKGAMGRALDSVNPVKRLRGSSRNLQDPIVSLMEGPMKMIQAGLENRVRQRIASEIGEAPGGGRFFIPLDAASTAARRSAGNTIAALRKGLLDSGNSKHVVDRMLRAMESELKDPNVRDAIVTMFTGGERPRGDTVMKVLRDGKAEYWDVTEPTLMRAIEAFHRPPPVSESLQRLRRFTQNLITATPDFMGANISRDLVSSSIQSKTSDNPFRALHRVVSGVKSIAMKDPAYRDFVRNLGGGSQLYERNAPDLQKRLIRHAARRGWDPRGIVTSPSELMKAVGDLVLSPLRIANRLGEISEMAPKLGEYKAARALGRGHETSVYQGKEVSADWTMRGDYRKSDTLKVNPLLSVAMESTPFLTASFTGTDRFYRSYIRDPEKRAMTAVKTAAYISAGMGLYMLNRDDPEYQSLSPGEKNAYVHLMPSWTGLPTILKIPKAFEHGQMLSGAEVLFDSLVDSTDPIERNYAKELGIALWPGRLNLPGGALPQFLAEQAFNRKIGPGGILATVPIETAAMERRIPESRYGPRTPTTIVKAGELAARTLEGTPLEDYTPSPARIEAALKTFFNGWSDYTMLAADKSVFRDESMPLTLESAPITRRFTVDANERSRYPTIFFDLVKRAERAHNTVKDAAEVKRNPELAKRAAKSFENKTYPMLRAAQEQVSNLNRQIQTIRFSKMDPDRKQELKDRLVSQQRRIEENAIRAVQRMRKAAGE
jgi:hypothetical protein